MNAKTVTFRPAGFAREFLVTGAAADQSVIGAIEGAGGTYEPHVCSLLARLVRPGDTCLDIGANIGVLSLVMAELARGGAVHAFEPSRFNFANLQANLAQNGFANAKAHNLGVYDEPRTLQFSFVEHVAGCSFGSTVGVQEGVAESIDCVVPDQWLPAHGVGRVDVIKLDVEGAEIHALAGLAATFRAHRPALVIEFNPTPLQRFYGEEPRALWDAIRAAFESVRLIGLDGTLRTLDRYEDLMAILGQGRGWEDLYCFSGPDRLRG